MDHHNPNSHGFFQAPIRCMPVFGTESEDPHSSGDFYMSNMDTQNPHLSYESSADEYRSQSYAYYAHTGPPNATNHYSYMPSEMGGQNLIQQNTGPMRIENSPAYDPNAHVNLGSSCTSIGLPLAHEQYLPNPMIPDPRSIQTDWLPVIQAGIDANFQDQQAAHEKSKKSLANTSRSRSKKDLNIGGGPMAKFQCFLCSKQYCRRSTLKTHLRHHSGERPYFCAICGKSFAQAANLTAHKRIHTGEKPFACPICCRPFSQSSSLVTHKRTHTGEKPYQCPRCDKAFTDSSTLTKHVRTHTGVKPYSCGICLLSFSQSGNLNRHMKTHMKQDTNQAQDANEMDYQINNTQIYR